MDITLDYRVFDPFAPGAARPISGVPATASRPTWSAISATRPCRRDQRSIQRAIMKRMPKIADSDAICFHPQYHDSPLSLQNTLWFLACRDMSKSGPRNVIQKRNRSFSPCEIIGNDHTVFPFKAEMSDARLFSICCLVSSLDPSGEQEAPCVLRRLCTHRLTVSPEETDTLVPNSGASPSSKDLY